MQRSDGLSICQSLYGYLKPHGVFPALTGGLLYKPGERKDCDIVLYRHRQNRDSFEISDIHEILEGFGFKNIRHFGFVTKAELDGFDVDLFNPESASDAGYEG